MSGCSLCGFRSPVIRQEWRRVFTAFRSQDIIAKRSKETGVKPCSNDGQGTVCSLSKRRSGLLLQRQCCSFRDSWPPRIGRATEILIKPFSVIGQVAHPLMLVRKNKGTHGCGRTACPIRRAGRGSSLVPTPIFGDVAAFARRWATFWQTRLPWFLDGVNHITRAFGLVVGFDAVHFDLGAVFLH